MAPMRPENPPTMCTIPDPAKSTKLLDFSPLNIYLDPSLAKADMKPSPQPQCTTIGYTNVVMMAE